MLAADMRVAAIVLVLATVPGALWIAGYLPLPSNPEEPGQAAVGTADLEEEEWRQRVHALCDWERKRARAFKEAYRGAVSPADALFAFDSTIRLARKSLAIFRSLDVPFEFQRESRELERLLEREQTALLALREAVRTGNRRAFVHRVQEIGKSEQRKRALFSDLGLRGCLPRAPNGRPDPDRSTV
jgi:hypothetical protein